MMLRLLLILFTTLAAAAQAPPAIGDTTAPPGPPAFSIVSTRSAAELETELNRAAHDGFRPVDSCQAGLPCRMLWYKQFSVLLERPPVPSATSQYHVLLSDSQKQLDRAVAAGFRIFPELSTYFTEQEEWSPWGLLGHLSDQAHGQAEAWETYSPATYHIPVVLMEKAPASYVWIKARRKGRHGISTFAPLDTVVKEIQQALKEGHRVAWIGDEEFETMLEKPAAAAPPAAMPSPLLLVGKKDEMRSLITDAAARNYRLVRIASTNYLLGQKYCAYMEPVADAREYLFLKSSDRAAFDDATQRGFRLVRTATLADSVILEKPSGAPHNYRYQLLTGGAEALRDCVAAGRVDGFHPVRALVGVPLAPTSCGPPPRKEAQVFTVLLERSSAPE